MFARRHTLTTTAGLVAFATPAFSADTLSPQAAQNLERERTGPTDERAQKRARRSNKKR